MSENKDNSTLFDISVIIPIYNVDEPFLRACLESVANQKKDKIEVLMIDDGSTNNSGEVADEYANKYSDFTCYHIPNGGVSRARNFGAKKAQGKYICFIDSDDIISEVMLEKLFIAAERDKSDISFCTALRFSSSKEWDSYIHCRALRNLDSITHIRNNHDLLYDTAVWNKLIRRDFWEKNNLAFPEGVLYEDIIANIQLHYLANQVSFIRSIEYLWRSRDMETVSITQTTTDLKNIKDRIKVLDLLDSFMEANVEEKQLCLENKIRILRYDMMVYLNVCMIVSKEKGLAITDIVRDYVSKSIPKEAFSAINLVEQRIYEALFENDYERLIQLVRFRKRELSNCPYFEKDGKIYVRLPENLFPEGCCDIEMNVRNTYPSVSVKDIAVDSSKIEIEASLFLPKVNIAHPEEQKLEAFLFDQYSGKEYPLEVQNFKNTELTKQKGTSFSSVLGVEESYNYDGTGYRIIIDSNRFKDCEIRDGIIILDYSNRYSEGKVLLKGMNSYIRKKTEGLSCVSGDSIVRAFVTAGGTLNFCFEKTGCTLSKTKLRASGLHLLLNEEAPLFAVDENEKVCTLEKSKEKDYVISAGKLEKDIEYGIFYKSENGELRPLNRKNKAVNLLSGEKAAFVVRSNKTHNVSLRAFKNATFLSDISRENDIIRLSTLSAGKSFAAGYSKARIVVDDILSNKKVVLAKAKCSEEEGQYYCDFEIDFSNEKNQKNFYKSNREVFIEYLGEGKKRVRHRIFASDYFKESFEYGTLGIVLYRYSQGYLKLKLELKWSEEELSKKKREALTEKNYPKYREEPLQKNLFLFESDGGAEYGGNLSEVYEYINSNYPQWECVWSLCDPRIPVKGRAKRVRKGSQEYFRVLATAKYLVNVSFEDAFVMRKGQKEVVIPKTNADDIKKVVEKAFRPSKFRIVMSKAKRKLKKKLNK